jgi:hypothetical protein
MPSIVPLAIYVTCRPHAGDDEPISLRPLLSPSKLQAEGAPAKIHIVLRWALTTRNLLLSLPDAKFKAWSVDLLLISDARIVARDKLESLIRRLNHASFVIPLSRHFLNRLRRFLKSSAQGKQQFTLAKEDIADLQLWAGFLRQAHKGISLNRIVKRQPSKLCIADSCPYGLGGFLISCRAWRLRIPATSTIYGDDTVNNILEFLAMANTIWLQLIDDPDEQRCILALGDNTSALGWIY